jgi:hypothetical protein
MWAAGCVVDTTFTCSQRLLDFLKQVRRPAALSRSSTRRFADVAAYKAVHGSDSFRSGIDECDSVVGVAALRYLQPPPASCSRFLCFKQQQFAIRLTEVCSLWTGLALQLRG